MLKIISRLWASITDLRLYIKGECSKSLEEIEEDLSVTEELCRPYAEAGDVEDIFHARGGGET